MATAMELKDIILETINTLESDVREDKELRAGDSLKSDEASKSSAQEREGAHLAQSSAPYEASLENLSAMFEHLGGRSGAQDSKDLDKRAPKDALQTPKNPPNPLLDSKTRLKPSMLSVINESHNTQTLSDERTFLKLLQDRLLVLFEGLGMPDKDSQKLTMVLNFLQYQLSVVAKRLENLEERDKSNRE